MKSPKRGMLNKNIRITNYDTINIPCSDNILITTVLNGELIEFNKLFYYEFYNGSLINYIFIYKLTLIEENAGNPIYEINYQKYCITVWGSQAKITFEKKINNIRKINIINENFPKYVFKEKYIKEGNKIFYRIRNMKCPQDNNPIYKKLEETYFYNMFYLCSDKGYTVYNYQYGLFIRSYEKYYLLGERCNFQNLTKNTVKFFKDIYLFICLNIKFNTKSVFYRMPKFILYKILYLN